MTHIPPCALQGQFQERWFWGECWDWSENIRHLNQAFKSHKEEQDRRQDGEIGWLPNSSGVRSSQRGFIPLFEVNSQNTRHTHTDM